MSDGIDAAIDDLRTQIAERMRAVNGLLKLKGMPAAYPDADNATSPTTGKIRSDQWYTKGMATAAREFLELRHRAGLGAASVDEIYSALVAGGFKFDQKDETYAKPALRQSLTKNTAIFHRLPNGHVGLAEWYSLGRNHVDDEPPQRRTKAKPTKRAEKRKTMKPGGSGRADASPNKTPISTSPATLLQAVKNGVAAMKEEFTKQQVFDWIVKHHPELKAQRESVFTMMARLKDDLIVVREGVGKQPFVYAKKRTEE